LVTRLRNDAFERHLTRVFTAEETRPDEQTGEEKAYTQLADAPPRLRTNTIKRLSSSRSWPMYQSLRAPWRMEERKAPL
jgi:hypothetical protein